MFKHTLAFFSDCKRTPSVWLASYGPDQKRISGKSTIEKLLRENAQACFQPTLRHEREDFAGAWDVSCLRISRAGKRTVRFLLDSFSSPRRGSAHLICAAIRISFILQSMSSSKPAVD